MSCVQLNDLYLVSADLCFRADDGGKSAEAGVSLALGAVSKEAHGQDVACVSPRKLVVGIDGVIGAKAEATELVVFPEHIGKLECVSETAIVLE